MKIFNILTFVLSLSYTSFCHEGGENEDASIKDEILEKIGGGKNSFAEQFPYVVYFRYNGELFCNGILISPDWILTLAHCFAKLKNLKIEVIAGEVFIAMFRNAEQISKPDQVVVHPEYNASVAVLNDIALVHTRRPFNITNRVAPVRLGSVEDGDGVPVLATYWGEYDDIDGCDDDEPRLKHIMMATLPRDQCVTFHQSFCPLTQNETLMCVFAGGRRGMCSGDLGTPLVRLDDGRLVGMLTKVHDCTGKYPFFYVKTEAYVDWIKKTAGI